MLSGLDFEDSEQSTVHAYSEAAGSDDESAVCFAPRQRVAPPTPMDSRSDPPPPRSPDNDVL